MNILLSSVRAHSGTSAFNGLLDIYVERIAAYSKVEVLVFRTEHAFMESLSRLQTRTPGLLVLLDSRGRQKSSEEFAAWIRKRRDEGRQRLIFAVGPAGGWNAEALSQAGLLLSLGPMTLPHELARVVLAEQVYRAFTMLAGHPYHSGH